MTRKRRHFIGTSVICRRSRFVVPFHPSNSRLWRYYVTPPPNPRPRGGGLVGLRSPESGLLVSGAILTGFSCLPVSLPAFFLILTACAPNLVRNTRCAALDGPLLSFLRTNRLFGDVWWVFLLPTPRIISSRLRFRGQNVAEGAERWTSGVIIGRFCCRRCKQMYLRQHLSAPPRRAAYLRGSERASALAEPNAV